MYRSRQITSYVWDKAILTVRRPVAARALYNLILLASIAAMPQALQAGSAPFDNTGRIQCNDSGLIDASLPKAQRTLLPVELTPGDMATIPAVCPAEPYFPTGVMVTPGATYQIDAQGLWKDGWIKVGPEGWRGLLLEAGNRLRWRPFFLISGSIGQSDDHLFPIGRSRRWTAPSSLPQDSDRRLFLFANDWPGMLHNNRPVRDSDGGPLRVTIRRID